MRIFLLALAFFCCAALGALIGTAGGAYVIGRVVTYTPPSQRGLICVAFDARDQQGNSMLAFNCEPVPSAAATPSPHGGPR